MVHAQRAEREGRGMSDDIVVHAFATWANPDTLPEPELRQALRDANKELLRLDVEVSALKVTVHSLDRTLSRICELRLANKWADLHAEIDRMAEYYQQQKAKQQQAGRVH